MNIMHDALFWLTNFSIIILEFIGVAIILVAALRAAVNYVRKDPHTRLRLCRSMAIALEFKLGAEILRTVIARDFTELALVGCIIFLRAAMALLIHWAIRTEENDYCSDCPDNGRGLNSAPDDAKQAE